MEMKKGRKKYTYVHISFYQVIHETNIDDEWMDGWVDGCVCVFVFKIQQTFLHTVFDLIKSDKKLRRSRMNWNQFFPLLMHSSNYVWYAYRICLA